MQERLCEFQTCPLLQVIQTKPFQLALDAHTQVLLEVLRTCPLRHVGIWAQDPWNMTKPGAHPQAFSWLFQMRPFEQVMHELPFQLDPKGQAQLLEDELHD